MLLGSIIIPVLNESQNIVAILEDVLKKSQGLWRVIVVDGGSVDDTLEKIKSFPITIISSAKGRAKQMNAGAEVAEGDMLLFLHGDTQLPANFNQLLQQFSDSTYQWGRFNIQLDEKYASLSLVSWFVNQRSRITGIATGDQGLFVRRQVFQKMGGFSNMDLMEDIDFSKRAKRFSKPYCIKQPVITSSRKWLHNGIVRTILLMWWLRFAFFIGVSPQKLHSWYYPSSNE